MSESDTMFNERDRRCAAVKHMLSTYQSYYNSTIASTLKMQIWIATNNRDVPRVKKTKFLATVMVFSVVSSEGHIMLPHIFEVDLKVNTKVYLDVLKSVVNPWCNQVAGGRPWVWQQDNFIVPPGTLRHFHLSTYEKKNWYTFSRKRLTFLQFFTLHQNVTLVCLSFKFLKNEMHEEL